MKKIFYAIGVYTFCVTVHDIWNTLTDGRLHKIIEKAIIDIYTVTDPDTRSKLYERYDIEEETDEESNKMDRMGF